MQYYEVEPTLSHSIDPEPEYFDLPNLTRIQVTQGKQVRNLIHMAMRHLKIGKPICIEGLGRETSKAITCAEIVKKNHKKLFQITNVSHTTTIETFAPLLKEMDPIEVRRSVPVIKILMSLTALDEGIPGYQAHRNYGQKSKKLINESGIEL